MGAPSRAQYDIDLVEHEVAAATSCKRGTSLAYLRSCMERRAGLCQTPRRVDD